MKKVLLVAVVSLGLLAGSVSSVNATSDWGDAIPIPALISLNTGANAQGNSVSCASAGNCAVTGYYQDSAGDQGFVVNQTDGTWGDAIPIPALISLNTGANAEGTSVSCASAGNCAVTGYYNNVDGQQGFVVNQTNGTWGNAIAIPALSVLNTGGSAIGSSVSCASAGNCAVTGYYNTTTTRQGFVVNQNNGDPWGNAIPIPALSVLNTAGFAEGTSVSCASAGNCAVTGSYTDGAGGQGFVVNQTGGTWGSAIAIPALIGLNTAGDADSNSVSCASAGNCAVTGYYKAGAGVQGFVVNQTNGTWGDAIPIPALIDLNTAGDAGGSSVSCASAGNCAVTGYYKAGAGVQGFVVNQTGGTWGSAIAIPALIGLNTAGDAGGSSVSCASAGNCAVTGSYADCAGCRQGFVVNQTNGTWGNAIAIPALIGLNTGGSALGTSVSCASAGNCAVTGFYNNGAGSAGGIGVVPARPAGDQGFVVNLTSVVPPATPTDPAVVLKFTG